MARESHGLFFSLAGAFLLRLGIRIVPVTTIFWRLLSFICRSSRDLLVMRQKVAIYTHA